MSVVPPMASAALDICGLMVSSRTCHHRLPRNAERSPFPATVDDRREDDACFVIRGHNGQALAYFYCEDDPGRRSVG